MSQLKPILEPILNSIDFESLEFKTSFNHKNHFERKSTFKLTPRVGSKSDILLSQANYCLRLIKFFFNLIVLICSTCVLNLTLVAHIFIYSSQSRADDESKLSREPIPKDENALVGQFKIVRSEILIANFSVFLPTQFAPVS